MKKYRLLSTALFMVLFLGLFGNDGFAAEPADPGTGNIADTVVEDEDVDPNRVSHVTIDLEKEGTMLGVSVYRIGNYTEDGFSYDQPYLDLVSRDYNLVNTQNELEKQIGIVSDYIKENNVEEYGRFSVENGVGTSGDLPVGLYVMIQNSDGSNAQLDGPIYVEAPTEDSATDTYMYDIHLFPKWEKTIWFSFRPEVVYPLSIICALIICALLCLFGGRILRSLIVAVATLLAALAGFQLSMKYTGSYLVSMVAFVFFGYLVIIILFHFFGLSKNRRNKTNIITTLEWVLVYVTPVIGAVCAAIIIYFFITTNMWIFIGIPVVVGIAGLFLQIRNTKNRKIFYTYDDLIGTKEKGDGKIRVWFWLNMLASVIYLFWRIFFTIPIGYGFVANVAGTMLLFVEALGLVEAIVHYANMNNSIVYKKPEIAPEQFPDVDVFIATYSEEADLLRKTILGCRRMDYPDKNKVHIYICDDGHREEIKQLAAELGVNYLDREDHSGQKAGNLNNGLAHSTSPYVVTFDADMIPQSAFLLETIPYFVDAEMRNAEREECARPLLRFPAFCPE